MREKGKYTVHEAISALVINLKAMHRAMSEVRQLH